MIDLQVPAVYSWAVTGQPCLMVGCDWSEMFDSVKKIISGRRQPSPPLPEATTCPRTQRRAPSTPPLPIRTLQLVAKLPETPVVLRERRKVKGHMVGVRESWPGCEPTTRGAKPRVSQRSLTLTPPSCDQPVTEALPRLTNQRRPHKNPTALSQNPLLPAAPHTHWSIPVKTPLSVRGSEATMTSLLLFCQR